MRIKKSSLPHFIFKDVEWCELITAPQRNWVRIYNEHRPNLIEYIKWASQKKEDFQQINDEYIALREVFEWNERYCLYWRAVVDPIQIPVYYSSCKEMLVARSSQTPPSKSVHTYLDEMMCDPEFTWVGAGRVHVEISDLRLKLN